LRPRYIARYWCAWSLAVTICTAAQIPAEFDRDNIKRPALSFRARFILNRAYVNDWPNVPVLVASRAGRNNAAADKILALGGRVEFRSDEIDYIRAILPTAKVTELFHSNDVLDVMVGNYSVLEGYDLDTAEPQPLPSRTVPAKASAALGTPSALPLLSANEMAADNSFLPTRDIGAPQFIASHPTFDGRGVTIALVEGWGDLGHPTLRSAKTLDGRPVEKVVAIKDVSSADDRSFETGATPNRHPDPILMTRRVKAEGSAFRVEGVEYIAPGPGDYRFGKWLPTEFSPLPGRRGEIAVLWDLDKGLVWLDTNGNLSFADEKPLRDFNESHDTGYLAVVAGGYQQSTALAVTIDRLHARIQAYECSNRSTRHATSVASVAAGKSFLGGEANGVAPEAQILYAVVWGNRTDWYLEALLAAANDPRVDVINCSFGTGTLPNDGESFLALMFNRVAIRFGKPIVVAASNYNWPETERVHDEAGASEVLTVGGYNSGATNYAFRGPGETGLTGDHVNGYSSGGPSSIGALKPDIVAPNWLVAAMPCSIDESTNASTVLYSFRLPPCYWSGSGTSVAAPMVAGAIALLISAARQSGVHYDSEALRWALTMSARRFPGYGVHDEGSGLAQVGEAWNLLQSYAKKPPVNITFAAPIRHQLSRYLKTPTTGVGLYERTGWGVGSKGERRIRVFRTGGSPEPLRCKISLLGNDGTFSVPESVSISNEAVTEIPIAITSSQMGIHDTVLRITDIASGLPLAQTALTIITPAALNATNSYGADIAWRLTADESRSFYVDVPTNTQCLKVQLSAAHNADVGLSVETPSLFRSGFRTPGLVRGAGTHLEANPEPGLWVFRVTGVPREKTEYSLRIEAMGAQVRDRDIDNLLAPVNSLARVERRGVIRTISIPASASEPQVLRLAVPAGSEALLLQLTAAESPRRSGPVADLYLYNCEATSCKLWDLRTAEYARQSRILVRWPNSGQWKVVVDPAPGPMNGLVLSEVLTGPTTCGPEWAPIEYTEAISPAAERQEEVNPLLDLSRWPSSSFRPVPIGLAVRTESTPKQRAGGLGTCDVH
jgi:hypothetical protein